MPLKQIYCADPSLRKQGRQVALPLNACLSCAATGNNPCSYTYPILSAMYAAQQDRGDNISTTSVLGKCTRKAVLERKLGYTQHPDDLWPAFKGTLTHEVLDKHKPPGSWGEVRVWAPVPGYERFISCKPDLVHDGVLYDYKTAKEIPIYGHIWPDQEAQLQLNRWIIDHAIYMGEENAIEDGVRQIPNPTWADFEPTLRPDEWTSLRITYITDARTATHEVTKSVDVPQKGDSTRTKKQRVTDIWSDEEVLDYMLPRYEELLKGLSTYPDSIPEIPPDLMGWSPPNGFPCNFCPVRKECVRLFVEEGR